MYQLAFFFSISSNLLVNLLIFFFKSKLTDILKDIREKMQVDEFKLKR